MSLWDHEEVLVSEYIDVPRWIEEELIELIEDAE